MMMPLASSARTHFGLRDTLRRPSRLFSIFALLVFLTALFFVFLRQKACNPGCVALVGDSITSKWQGPTQTKQLFGLQIVNRGIPGDFTDHMPSRFDHDVVQLHPRS
jgi:hypothetical protein